MSGIGAAWQAVLAAEQQAVFGYGLLGPRLPFADQPFARACSVAHQQRQDTVAATLATTERAAAAPAPLADYPSLYPVADAAAARRVAVRVEDACAEAWRYLYLQAASTAGTAARRTRAAAQDGLASSAIRATIWRALIDPSRATVPFPGV